MKKHTKGFTLVELLVVIGILGILMGVLYPAISSAMNKTAMNTFAMNGKKIVDGIIATNTDRMKNGKPTVWPHINEKDGLMKSGNKKDIAATPYTGTSTQYFEDLFDIKNQTNGDRWRPYVDGYEPSWLAGGGVPPHQPGSLTSEGNGWTVVAGLTDELGTFLPVLVSRNADVSMFATTGQNDMSTRTDEVDLGKQYPQPFGNKGCVVVCKGGQARTFSPRDATLDVIYQQNSFKIPDGITLKYLQP